jgi:hypothetical protein
MQELTRRTNDPKASPAELEAFARYLSSTGGDSKPIYLRTCTSSDSFRTSSLGM